MPITCSICQKKCANQRGLNIHISRKHRQDVITDHGGKVENGHTSHRYCSGITDNHESNLNEEIGDTHRQRPSTFDSKHRHGPSTIVEHRKDDSVDETYRLPKPSCRAKEKNFQTNDQTMPITCSICQKVCANQRGLNIHISRKHRQDGITDHGGKADKGTTVQGYCSGITENHESNFNEEIYDTHRQRPSTIHHQGPHIIEGNDDKHRQRPSTFDSKHRRGPSTIEENEEKYRRRTSTLEENDEKHRTEKATPATCGICQREFKNERGLSVHMSRKHKQGDRHDHKEPRRITTTIEDNDNKHRPRPSSIEENDDKYRQRRSSIEENDDKLRRRPSSIEENYNKHRRRTSSVEENDDKLRRRTSSTGGKDESTEKSDGKPSPRSTVEDDRKFPTVKRMHNACCSHCGDADGGSTKSRLLENHISITSPSNSSLPFHVTNVTKYIAMLEGEIKIRRKDNASTRKGVNEFIESLNKAMDGISNIPLKMLNSGSYYDKTSIEYDDEFDFMVCPSGKFEAVFTNCPPGFCKIRKGRTTIDDLDQALNKDGYLVPELFKQKMFSIFEDCITSPGFRQGRRIKRMPRKPESPAFTLQFDLGSGIPTVDIDLVPAVRIDSWPSTGRKICPEWIGTDNVQKAMKCFHVVTKTYPADHPDADILWRISFSHAEKELILHANQRDKGCRKDILKLLKKIKEIIKVQNPHQTDKFCSYHLKMFMLEFYDRHKDFCQEKKESLFKQSVKELMKCFSNGEIRNYFIPEDNILRFVSDNEKSLVTQELRKIQEKF